MTEEGYARACAKAVEAAKTYVDAMLAVRPDLIAEREGVSRRDRDRIERESGLVEQMRRLVEVL